MNRLHSEMGGDIRFVTCGKSDRKLVISPMEEAMKRLLPILACALLALVAVYPVTAANVKLTFVYWGSVNKTPH